MEIDIKLRWMVMIFTYQDESMNYCFILWFAVRATHRYTTLPVVRSHQSATQFYIKFSRINEKKEENSHKAKLYRTSAREKKSETSSG